MTRDLAIPLILLAAVAIGCSQLIDNGSSNSANGVVASSLQVGATVARSTLLARIDGQDGKVIEVRSPLPGRIQNLNKANGAQVSQGDEILSLHSDENSVWEALRGLSFVGSAEDVPIVESYANSTEVSARIRDQANLTLKAIQTRIKEN